MRKKEPLVFKYYCTMCGKRMEVKGTGSDLELCKCDIKDLERYNRKLGLIK